MGRKIQEDKLTKRDVIEVLILIMTFLGFLFNDFLINAVNVYFAFGMIFSGVLAIIIAAILIIVKRTCNTEVLLKKYSAPDKTQQKTV